MIINPALLYTGSYIPPDVDQKFIFSTTTGDTSNNAAIVALYNTGFTDALTIESDLGIGVSGILIIQITYTRLTIYLSETINVDKTNSTVFWNDIKNWMYLNNYIDITYDSGLDKWILNDSTNKSYLHIKYISG